MRLAAVEHDALESLFGQIAEHGDKLVWPEDCERDSRTFRAPSSSTGEAGTGQFG